MATVVSHGTGLYSEFKPVNSKSQSLSFLLRTVSAQQREEPACERIRPPPPACLGVNQCCCPIAVHTTPKDVLLSHVDEQEYQNIISIQVCVPHVIIRRPCFCHTLLCDQLITTFKIVPDEVKVYES